MIPARNISFKDPNWRPKVLVTHHDIPESGIKLLREKCDVTICTTSNRSEILEKSKGMDGILWATHETLDSEALDAAGPQLKVLTTYSVGLDFVDVEEVKRRGIKLGYTPGVLTDAVADIAIGLAISASRNFYEGRLFIEGGKWVKRAQFLMGQDICGSTVGIVGFGAIGQRIAKRFTGFDVGQLLYSGHREKPEGDKIGAKFVTFDALVRTSDFIFISCPLTPETHKMFNAEVFAKMKPTTVLINVARGDNVDQEALYSALKNRKIFSAGIDVMSPEPLPPNDKLLELPNCVITPHIASSTVKTRNAMSEVCAINILAGLAGEALHSPVF